MAVEATPPPLDADRDDTQSELETDVGKKALVPYSATYVFFRTDVAGDDD